MIKNDRISDNIGRAQFDAIAYSLYLFGSLQHTGAKAYTIADLSHEFNKVGSKKAILNQLKEGRDTYELFRVADHLNTIRLLDPVRIDYVLGKINSYTENLNEDHEKRDRLIGIYAHTVLELFFFELFERMGIVSSFETKMIQGANEAQIDTIIKNDLLNHIDIDKLATLLTSATVGLETEIVVKDMLETITDFMIDFCTSSDLRSMTGRNKGKTRRGYHDINKFLFIINYHPAGLAKNTADFTKSIRKNMVKNVIPNPNRVVYISVTEFLSLFSLEDTEGITPILELIEKAYDGQSDFDELSVQHIIARGKLRAYKEQFALEGRKIGWGSYLGDL